MTPRERVLRAIEHRSKGGRIPFTVSTHDSLGRYGEPLLKIIRKVGCDFYDVETLKVPESNKVKSSETDQWGCVWDFAISGKGGLISCSPLDDWENFKSYQMPSVPRVTAKEIEAAKDFRQRFPVWGGVEQFFQIMQNLRGTEKVMMDFYLQPEEIQQLIDRMLNEYHLPAIEEQLKIQPDIIGTGDDWGTQSALFINPEIWRQFFKPAYKKMIDLCHQGGAKVWFHSCGYTCDILPDWIELGLDVINPQITCMDVAEYGETARGKITVNPDLSRQHILLNGTPEDVQKHVYDVYSRLGNANGGLIGYAPLEAEMPLENLRVLLETISNFTPA